MHTLGKFDQAEVTLKESLTILEQLGDRLGKADAQSALALIYKHHHQPGKAEALQRDTMGLYNALHYPVREMGEAGNLLLSLGQIAIVEGAAAEAAECLKEAAETMMVLWPNDAGQSLTCLAYVSLTEDELPPAVSRLSLALHWLYEIRSYVSSQYCLPVAALLAARCGELERAVELYALSKAFGYVSNSRWFADIAGRKLEEIAASLPADAADEARARGTALDIWQTTLDLSEEFANRE